MEHVPSPRPQGLYDPRFEHDSCGIGFVVDAHGRKSHAIVAQAIQVLLNLEHRGACGCEKNTGDGAGILLQMPHAFLAEECDKLDIVLPDQGRYAAGLVFLPNDPADRRRCEELFEKTATEECVAVLGWRTPPTDNSSLGTTARAGEPVMRQVFVSRPPAIEDDLAYERKLYVLRRRVENAVRESGAAGKGMFYVPSLSHRTLVYKGMLIAPQLPAYFPDIVDARVESSLAMVHSRFSTNTFPNWARAHPYRFVCHNGEINTLRGNVNWMHARESLFESKLFGGDFKKILPVIDTDGSDSAMFDNVLELLVLAGRSLPHAVMMMIPEPWAGHESMSEKKRAFYEYHSCLMEPWDGPASIAFTDGVRIGATLDRNGLRPSRYYVTKDGLVVLGSEVGVLDIPADRVLQKGRLQPGRMFLVDTEEGRIVADEEIKLRTANERPYALWLRDNLVTLQEVPEAPSVHGVDHDTVQQRQVAFGYTREDLELLLAPMAREGVEPVGSMGNDTPLAVLSEQAAAALQLLQAALRAGDEPADRRDPRRDHHGRRHDDRPRAQPARADAALGAPDQAGDADAHERRAREAALARHAEGPVGRVGLQVAHGPDPLPGARGRRRARTRAGRDLPPGLGGDPRGHQHRRAVGPRDRARSKPPIPALLAVSGVHHHLIREGTRTQVGLVLESGEPREVHHLALLIGYGAGAVNPYLAFETLHDMGRQGLLPNVDEEHAVKNYIKTLSKGVMKVISKMGISTIQSYCGAQIFEAIGLDGALVERYFTGTPSRIGGIGIDVIAREVTCRHARAFSARLRRWTSTRAATTSGGTTASGTSSTPRPSTSCSTPAARAATRASRNTPGSSTNRAASCTHCAA